MTELMINEYIKVTEVINNIRNIMNIYIKNTEETIKKANELEKEEIIIKFNNILLSIKNDPDIISKYGLLKKRHNEIKNDPKVKPEIMLLLLKNKYQ